MTDTLPAVKAYQQFIGGAWVDAASGETLDVINPANDQVIAKVPKSAAEDVDRAVDAADAAFATWRPDDAPGSVAHAPQDRGSPRLASRRARPAGERQRRQAGRRRHRRDGRLLRPLPVLRRRGAGDGRPGSQRVRCRAHLDHPARSDRRDRVDRPVELPPVHGQLEARAGPCHGQHGRPEAISAHAADVARVRGDPCRGPAGRGGQRPVRSGRRHRRCPRRPPQGPDGVDHRRHRHRQAGREDRRGQREAAPPRARWQGPGHRVR